SRLWRCVDGGRMADARRWLGLLTDVFGARLSVEVAHHLRPGDGPRASRLARLAEETGVPLLMTGDVRHAAPGDYARYDLLTGARLGLTVFAPHPDRPGNAEAPLKAEPALRRLIPYEGAFARAAEVAAACRV